MCGTFPVTWVYYTQKLLVPFYCYCNSRKIVTPSHSWAHVSSCDVMWAHESSCDVMWCHVSSCDVLWAHESLCLVHQALKKSERAPGTHMFAHARFPRFSGELGNFRKIYFVTLNLVCQSISPLWKMPAIDHAQSKRWRRSDEDTQLFACKNYSPVCPFQVNTARDWCNLSLWS